jgi:hypothetical protein
MSTDRDTARVVRSWMDEGVTELPERVLDSVLDQLPATPQRRAIWLPARRIANMNTLAKIAIAAAAVAVVAVVGFNLLPTSSGLGGSGAAVSPSPTAPPSPSPSSTPMAADVLDVQPVAGDAPYSVTVQGVRLSFNVSTPGWESHGGPYISKSVLRGQAAEAIIFWAGFPDGDSADPCAPPLGQSVGPSAADLARAVSTAAGTELVTGPSDVTVGGHAAKRLVLTVLEDVGCDPGYFYSWDPFSRGALWLETKAGDTIWVWIVDVDGTRLFIAGETRSDAGSELEDEIQQIVNSIQFE